SVELWINRTGFVDQTILSVVEKASVIELQANEGLDEIVITGEVRNRRRLASRNERLAKKPAESSAKISGLPTREVDGAMTRTAGVRSEGTEEVAIRGSRTDADTYYVDGVSVSEVEKGETFEDAIATEPAMSLEEAFARGMGSIETDYPVPPAEKLPEAGQLTAGEVNDFGKWELWEDVSREDLAAYREVWQILPAHRYAVQLTFPGGQPATNLTVQLVTQDGRLIWTARTDNFGRAELWRGLFQANAFEQDRLVLRALYQGQSFDLPTAHTFQEGFNSLEIPVACTNTRSVDVTFVVDATGSMGDEIRYLSGELLDVMRRATDSLRGQDIRLASVFYRDLGDAYLTRHLDFSSGIDSIVGFVQKQSASGGGDTPEAVDEALDVALNQLQWRDEAVTRLLFLVLDAPPHRQAENLKRIHLLTQQAAKAGIRIIPVVCSGMDQSGEYLLRSMALATNGTYTFLTDHSGIGGSHLEPSTDAYEVEKLNDLLVRLIYQFGQAPECGEGPIVTNPQLDEQKTDVQWSVYPNPTNGMTTIQSSSAKGEAFLLDGTGKLLRRIIISAPQTEIALANLPSGMYFLRYEQDGTVTTKRVILERTK
ncbi:MAG: T9SS type A sorting domain-containing protein, partial [Bacteroidota bacterium]